jgi:hypothetical protein
MGSKMCRVPACRVRDSVHIPDRVKPATRNSEPGLVASRAGVDGFLRVFVQRSPQSGSDGELPALQGKGPRGMG